MSTEFKKIVGERVYIIRKKLNLTQGELGESLGCSQGKVKDIEKGRIGIIPETAIVLAEKYKISLDWLYLGRGEMFDRIYALSEQDRELVEKLLTRLSK